MTSEPGVESITSPSDCPVPISAAAARTGVTPAALRADIDRIQAVQNLIRAGVRAGDAVRTALSLPGPASMMPTGSVLESDRGLCLPDDVHPAARELAAELARLDGPRTASVLSTHLTEHSVTSTWETLLRPVLGAVGRQSAGLPQGLVMERLLCYVARQELTGHAARTIGPTELGTSGPARPPAILTTAPAEQHDLPLVALAAALAERAIPAVRLDFETTVEVSTATDDGPPDGPDRVPSGGATLVFALAGCPAGPATLARIRHRHPPVILAGPGWSARALSAGLPHRNSLADAVSALERHRVSPHP